MAHHMKRIEDMDLGPEWSALVLSWSSMESVLPQSVSLVDPLASVLDPLTHPSEEEVQRD